jgi:hypothetical protein
MYDTFDLGDKTNVPNEDDTQYPRPNNESPPNAIKTGCLRQ